MQNAIFENRTLVDMLGVNARLDRLFTGHEKKIKIALIASFTIDKLAEVVRAEGFLHGLNLTVYTTPYGQFQQEILDTKSALYAFRPDICFLLYDFSDFFVHNLDFLYHTHDRRYLENESKFALSHYKELIKALQKASGAKIVASTLPLPTFRPLSIIDNKHKSGFVPTIAGINRKIEDLFRNDPRTFIFDFDTWLGRLGKDNVWYKKFYFLGDLRLEPEAFPALARCLMAYVIPTASMTKKCIVLDLDNTLWGGVAGEDGMGGIKLSPAGEGQQFYHFQKHLVSLFHRGIILAINSRNNEDDALEIIRNHPHMLLRENHFAAWRINWNDKVANMKELADELQIGLDAMVFIDDDPMNIALVNEFLPMVVSIAVPKDTSEIHTIIADYPGFSSFWFTKEDRQRGKMYLAEHKRHQLRAQVTNIEEFLKSLDLRLQIEPINDFSLARAAQLTQKTNQFNVTTRRYSEDAVREMLKNGFLGFTIDLCDKFGNSGITGVAIVKRNHKIWTIDTFLLSCRVLGRGVERSLLAFIIDQAKKGGAKKIRGEFIPTKKNKPSESFFDDADFTLIKSEEGKKLYEFDLKKDFPYPPFIKVVRQS